MSEPPSSPPADSRARLLYAGGALLALSALVAAVLVLSGREGEARFTAAPEECLDRWNSDRGALGFGRHNALAHGYATARVFTLAGDGEAVVSATDPDANCAVVFAANSLDPERGAAGQIHLQGEWQPLSALVDPSRLESLQSEAVSEANASLTPSGDLDPL